MHGNDLEKDMKRQRRKELLEKKRLREQQIIRKHLREFVGESNPMAKMDEEEEEEEIYGQESLIDEMNVQLEGTDMMKGTASSSSSPKEKNLVVSLSSFSGRATTPRPTTTKKSSKRKSFYSSEHQARKESSKPNLKRSKSNESSRQDDARSKVVPEGKKNKRNDKQPASRKVPQDVISSSSIARPSSSMSNVSSKKSQPASVVPKKTPKPRAVKKCHDCRKSSNRHRVCNFWKLSGFTGAKCGKVFCIDCLTSKYSVGDDVHDGSKKSNGKSIEEIMKDPALDFEWHCPSCLGVCQCHVCVAHRKREEEREKNRGDGGRKSQRRTTAHSSYYNFF